MKVKSSIGFRGTVTVRVLDKYGNVIDEDVFHNLIVNVGKQEVVKLISGQSGTAFGYIAIGTGTTSESASDTDMEAETKRKAATKSIVTTTITNDTARFVATFSSSDGLSGTTAVTEYGLFNASTGGTMLSHAIKAAKNMDWDSGEQLEVTWDVQVQ